MRDGRLVQVGTPSEIYHRPASRFVAQFMGEVNIFTVQGGRIRELQAHGGHRDGYLIVRPEHVRPTRNADIDVSFDATIANQFMLGSRTQFHLDAGGTTVIAELPAAAAQGLEADPGGRWGFDLDTAVALED